MLQSRAMSQSLLRSVAGLSLLALTACAPHPSGPGSSRHALGTQCTAEVPSGCTEVLPGETLKQITTCRVIKKAGVYEAGYVNVARGGALYFVEDPGGNIDLNVRSLLVEQGGLVQAGSESCPFGTAGTRLSFGLYGDDPTKQDTVKTVDDHGIQCSPDQGGTPECFPTKAQPMSSYCWQDPGAPFDPSDPCASQSKPTLTAEQQRINGTSGDNFKLEPYGDLNFDHGPFGYKVLAVSYGGSLRLFGARAHPTADVLATADQTSKCRVPTESGLDEKEARAWARLTGSSWTRLDGQQDDGKDTLLTLDRVVHDWTVGDEIVVAPTDWYPNHHETRTILAVTQLATATQLRVEHLAYPHVARIFDTHDIEKLGGAFTGPVRRSVADLRAPVGLLTRSIRVHSLGATAKDAFPGADECMADESDPNKTDPRCYFGGHVLFRQGFADVQVEGVEFKQLGQGGRMGHYPVHFHLGKSTTYTKGKTFIRDSSIWDSMSRFVVLHGTHDVDISRNVGFLSVGHGFYGEDATEIDNGFCHNLGIGARAATTDFYLAQKKELLAARAKDPTVKAPPTVRAVPPILDGVTNAAGQPRSQRMGSDGLMPVMFWMMNAYNEQVGNQASGVYGFGSCYWLLGSARSGASLAHDLDGVAAADKSGGFQAPVLRFRGNGCSTASLALPASAELPPSTFTPIGFTEMNNPYLFEADRKTPRPASAFQGHGDHRTFDRPIVSGNFRPIQIGSDQKNCAGSTGAGTKLDFNTSSCAMTYIDRFTTSFNWTEVNFGSIWLRPWFYTFANGAVTDQLFGGLTFVTAGSWIQVPPAYFSLAQNNLFVGTTQYKHGPIGASIYADKTGPIMRVHGAAELQNGYAACGGGKTTCNFDAEGVGYWQRYLQPKRLLNIYDGPAHADGNTFLNVGAWDCDPTPCAHLDGAACFAKLAEVGDGTGDRRFACGIYSSTQQPALLSKATLASGKLDIDPSSNPHTVVMDAAIGWKQPNGFYYPPAFGHANEIFLKKVPVEAGVDGANDLNRCWDQGKAELVPGDCRHNAIDRTQPYVQGALDYPRNGPNVANPRPAPGMPRLQTSPIDFQTVLIDIDGTLTGATGTLGGDKGVVTGMPTTSVSRNRFFDAPAQDDECLSYGVQTSPYTFATTAIAKLDRVPQSTAARITTTPWPETPMVPIYRQWALAHDEPACGDVCNGAQYGCSRASVMMGASIYQASQLTMSIPGGSHQPGALYYLDTNAAHQSMDCIAARTGGMRPAPFAPDDSFVIYNLFARPDTRTSYSLYVGKGVRDLSQIDGRFVRVDPHLRNGGSEMNSDVMLECDPQKGTGWCGKGSYATLHDGVVTVTLDHSVVADAFETRHRADWDRCMPRDTCYFDGDECKPCVTHKGALASPACKGKIVADDDVASLVTPAHGANESPMKTLCDWSTRASGTSKRTANEPVFVDCPEGGCLGFAFKLPHDFHPLPYAVVNAHTEKPAACFEEHAWTKNALQSRMSGATLLDPLCGAARPSEKADYCAP